MPFYVLHWSLKRLLIVSNTCQICLKDVLIFELSPVSHLLTNADGNLWNGAKRALCFLLERDVNVAEIKRLEFSECSPYGIFVALKDPANRRNKSQHCCVLLANNVESVCMDLKVWPVSNYTQQVPTSANIVVVPCKRAPTCWAQQCCLLLAINVASVSMDL